MDVVEIERAVALEDGNWWYQERRAIIARELRRLPKAGHALDLGAAGGGNTRVLLDHGWTAVATDFSPEAVEHAVARGLDAVQADARDLPFPSTSFDFVQCLDVMEHIVEDDQVASEIARVLRPGGTALISVPADMRLWSAHDESLGHVRRYTREGLASVLTGAGLVVDDLRSWNVLLRPVAAVRRKKATGCDLEQLSAPVNAALLAIVRAERYLPLGKLPGISLFARVRRPR
ncbi:hypothetical protein GCM10027589_34170 [Actinocorallia lasiicapitis]